MTPARLPRLAAAIAAAALLTSCSTVKLAYNQADWLVSWEVGKFVDLDGPSRARFKEGFAALWSWHRSTQLDAYAADLRELAEAMQGPLSRDQIEAYRKRASAHGERLVDEALPAMASVLAALDDRQVAGMLEKLAEQRHEEADEDEARTAEETRELYARNFIRGFKRWLGPISDAQAQRVGEWAASRRDEPGLWRRYGEQWAQAFEGTLATRAEPGFEARLRGVFEDPDLPDREAVRALIEENRGKYLDLLASLAPTLTEKQRRHLRNRLLDLAEDFEELARQRQQAAAGEAIG